MDLDPIPILQLPLFDYGESITNVVELFPAVWQATEFLASPEIGIRQHGLDTLVEIGAQKVSPLVAYMIATCLNDPDFKIRKRAIFILADLLTGDPGKKPIPEEVKKVVKNYLHHINEHIAFILLEVSASDPQVDPSLYQLFNSCPYAGKYLGDIATQWKNPLPIRQKAIYFIGVVGFLEALPVLEKLMSRLEARQNGQYMMSFAPSSSKSDEDLLPYLRVAINQLNTR
jgi:hypothetical protein